MKKFFTFILLATLFVACGDDDDDNIVYLDNSLVQGNWYRIQASDSVVSRFKDNVATRIIYDRYTGDERSNRNNGYYRLTETDIIYQTGNQPYKLNKDSLWLYNNDEYIKYIKVKE